MPARFHLAGIGNLPASLQDATAICPTSSSRSGSSGTRPLLPRIVMRTGEALVEAAPAYSAAEPEVVIGELDGPVGDAIANLIGDQTKGHSRVFAILNCDVQVRPVTLMVSKVTVKNEKYTNILMGRVQAGIAHGVLDAAGWPGLESLWTKPRDFAKRSNPGHPAAEANDHRQNQANLAERIKPLSSFHNFAS